MSSPNGFRTTPAERPPERSPPMEDRSEKSPNMPSLRARLEALKAGSATSIFESVAGVRPYPDVQTERISQQARLQAERVQSDLILRGLLSGLQSLRDQSRAETAHRQSQRESQEWRKALKAEVQRRMSRFQELHGQPEPDGSPSLQVPPESSLRMQNASPSEMSQQVPPGSSPLQSRIDSESLQRLQALHSEYQQSRSSAEQSQTLQKLCDELRRMLDTASTDTSLKTLVMLLSGLQSLLEQSREETTDLQTQREADEFRRTIKTEVWRKMNQFLSFHQAEGSPSLQSPPEASLQMQSMPPSEGSQQIQPESSPLQSRIDSDKLQLLQALHSKYQQSESPAQQSQTLQALCEELSQILEATSTRSDMSLRTLVTLQAELFQPQSSAADPRNPELDTTLRALQAELNATNPQAGGNKEARGEVPPAPPTETLQELPAESRGNVLLMEDKLTDLASEVRHMMRQLQLEAGTSASLVGDQTSSAGSTAGWPPLPSRSQGNEERQLPLWNMISILQQEMDASKPEWKDLEKEAAHTHRPRVSALLGIKVSSPEEAEEDKQWQSNVELARSQITDVQREERPTSHALNFMESLLGIALQRKSSSVQDTHAVVEEDVSVSSSHSSSSWKFKWNFSSGHTSTRFPEDLLAAARRKATTVSFSEI